MAYYLSYSSFQEPQENQRGYTVAAGANSNTQYWNVIKLTYPVQLQPGEYLVSANVMLNNSPNTYAYILANSSAYSPSPNLQLSSIAQYQGDIPNTDYSNFVDVSNNYVVASQQFRKNVSTSSSSAVSLSCTVYIPNSSNLNNFLGLLFYNQNSGEKWVAQIVATRIT